MGLLLLIIVLVLIFGGGGYYGHRSGWYGRGYADGPRSGGMSLGMFLLVALVLILLFGGLGGPYLGYWHY
jgi:hypothetical protein